MLTLLPLEDSPRATQDILLTTIAPRLVEPQSSPSPVGALQDLFGESASPNDEHSALANLFLFAPTTARFVCALRKSERGKLHSPTLRSDLTEFLDDFTATVQQGSFEGARILWNSSPFTFSQTTHDGPVSAIGTFLVELGVLLRSRSLSRCAAFLPGPDEEHSLSIEVTRRQERMSASQARLADGCHLIYRPYKGIKRYLICLLGSAYALGAVLTVLVNIALASPRCSATFCRP